MATTRFIDIKVRSKGAEKNVDKLDRKMKGLGREVDKTTASMFSLSKVASGVGAGLAIAALSSSILEATKVTIKFNAAISNLSAITGATGKDLDQLRQIALNFGETTTLSASQAAEALKLVASAKPDLLESAEALAEVTKQAILLSEASGVQLAASAKTVGNALNQFGADADQAARFVNVLAAGAKFGSSEIEQTAAALKIAGVAAADAGISFEETNAAIQVLAQTGISAERAGTGLRNIFLKLDSDADKSLRPSLVGINQALINLNKQSLDSTQLLKKFGLENIIAAKVLTKNVDLLGSLTGKLSDTNTATEQASRNIDNLQGDLKSLGSAYESLQISIGELTDGELRDFTQALTGVLRAVNGNEEALKEWGDVVDGSIVAVETIAVILASKLVVALGATAAGFLATAVNATKATITTNAFGQVIARTSVASNVAAASMLRLNAAMALVGGPLGVIALAVFALHKFVNIAPDVEGAATGISADIDGLAKSFGSLSNNAQIASLIALTGQIESVGSALADAKDKSTQAQKALNDAINADASLTFLEDRQKAAFAFNEAKKEEIRLEGELLKLNTVRFGLTEGGGTESVPVSTGGETPSTTGLSSAFQNRLSQETEQLRLELALRQAVTNESITAIEASEVLAFTAKATRAQANFDAEIIKLGENEIAKAELTALFREQQLLLAQEFQANMTAAELSEIEARTENEIKANNLVLASKQQTQNALLGLLSSFAGKSKAVALAMLALQKSSAIANAWTGALAGSVKVFGELPYPAAVAASSQILAQGKLTTGLIAATGLAQGAGIISGGSSVSTSASIGGGATVNTGPTAQTPVTTSDIVENTSLTRVLESLENSDRTIFGIEEMRALAEALTDAQDSGQV